MTLILGVIILFILVILIWFNISYSPIKSEFAKLVGNQLTKVRIQNDNFIEEDISKLLFPVQKYFHYCGYIGKPKMSNMKAVFNNYKDIRFIIKNTVFKRLSIKDIWISLPLQNIVVIKRWRIDRLYLLWLLFFLRIL